MNKKIVLAVLGVLAVLVAIYFYLRRNAVNNTAGDKLYWALVTSGGITINVIHIHYYDQIEMAIKDYPVAGNKIGIQAHIIYLKDGGNITPKQFDNLIYLSEILPEG